MWNRYAFATLLAACGGLANGQIGTITTYAGNSSGSYPGNGGPATSALIYNPSGLAVDGSGNLYLAASGGNLIQQVNAATGIITTVAGGGTGGDGGLATAAQLDAPCDVKLDSAGDIYLSETCVVAYQGSGGNGGGGSGNGGIARIRRVDAVTGIITTIAGNPTSGTGFAGDGGPAASALLNLPIGLAIDSAGDIFIADSGNNRVRRIDGTSGIITTVAGNGIATFAGDGGPATSASLNSPSGIAVDGSGNLYIADTANNCIRRVDAVTGNISTVAGTSLAGFNGDGIAATSATLNKPVSVILNPSGNLVVTDLGNNRVRTIDNSGLIWTLAGDGISTGTPIGDNGPASMAVLDDPEGVALLPSGPLFISELLGNRVRQDALPGSLAAVAVTVSSTGTTFAPSAPVTLTATLAATNAMPFNATGGVYFFDSGYWLGEGTVANGSASFTTSLVALGTHNISAVYPGDSNFAGSYSPIFALTIANATTVSLAASPNPAAANQAVTLTAFVSPSSATGMVTFFNGSASLGGATLSGGTATLSSAGFAAGAYSLTAQYSGDGTHTAATSSVATLTVKSTSSVTVTSSANPSPSGQSVTFTATVSPAAATGSVQFLDGSTVLGSVTLNGSSAVFSTSSLAAGTHTISAVYSGDSNYLTSTSSTIAQSIQTASSITLLSLQNPSPVGQPATFVATVTPPTATGSVQFLDGTTVLGTVTLSGGSATLATSSLTQGTHSITAVYSGDANDTASTSTVLSQGVKLITGLGVTLNPNPAAVSQTVTITGTLNPAATGTVQFLDGSTVLATVTLSAGTASYSTSALAQGTHSITLIYSGDTNYLSTQSATYTLTVNAKGATSTAIVSLQNPSPVGQPATFVATVTPSTATGSVQFLDGATVLGTVTLSGGSATFATSSLAQGTHSITAVYSGDANDTASTSAVLSQGVKLITGLGVTLNPNPAAVGQTVVITGTLNPAATGTVQFLDGSTVLATVTLSAGTVSYSTSALAQGAHSITLIYSGDTNYLSTQSATYPLSIKAAASVALSSSVNPASPGQSVSFTATVTPSAATGSVQFLDGSTLLATVSLSGSSAVFSTTALAAGVHSISAVYGGDSNYIGATSPVLAQTIKAASTTTVISTQNPSPVGQPATFIATVTPSTATGTVQFLDGTTVLGTVTVSGGSASFTTSSLAQGTHSITAVYSGDASDTASTSAVLSQGVKLMTGLAVTLNPNPAAVGQTIVITGTLNSAATGTVQFLDGSTVLATITISAGTASYSTSALAQGTHSITLIYSGDANYLSTQSATYTLTVNAKAVSSTTIVSLQNPTPVGQPATFVATINPSTATGTVQFLDGTTVLGTVTVSGGSATFATSSLAQGTHSITAAYSGDASDTSSTSAVLSQAVKLITGLAVTLNPNPAVVGQTVTITGSVNPAATGTIQFLDGSTVLATVAISAGTAAYSTSALALGTHTITLIYSGDANYGGAGSATYTLTVNPQAASSVSLASSLNPATVGQTVTFTATVSPSSATGTVQFLDGTTVLGTSTVNSGVATFSTTALAEGSHSITASYSGNASYLAGTSGVIAQVENGNTTTALSSSLNPSIAGEAVTFTASVTPSAATGTVQFFNGPTSLGTATVSGGTASLTTEALTTGSHSIKAVFTGATGWNGSTSSTLTQTVKTATTISVTSNDNPARHNSDVTFTATVSPSSATGTVQFFDGTTSLGTASLSGGRATLSVRSWTDGTHPITAVYSGDSTHGGSTSAVLDEVIQN
jgi:predicted secreted protein